MEKETNKKTIVQFKKWSCILLFDKYSNNDRTAIELVNEKDGSPVAIATVNIPDVYLEKDEVIIKNYSENNGMIDALIKSGVIEPTGRKVKTGFVECDVCKLLITK